MQIGDRVRVKTSVIVYHHPDHRNEAFDLQGSEGEITGHINTWQGRPISPNYPFQVKFGSKFRAHLRVDELESAETASTEAVSGEVIAR
ncbi:ferredoxin-thioredoxin reductase variable chain [Leptolyngbya sp. FACHB-261]|uniref:ferredoxin-thioredoxin reductase variable chain n=1 Tax=Leptolyngbya sp. FACHB-261 TaxID=2692806 RepID=UPI0016853BCA|nr:ferredoxin-thioredoxin reductase variable chain [Leptolyngbya sp. FACHB-261]MBD2104078.1 ferredoxin-thioredoxin reductase variable chain [Leptolyngbya sp. FACHB-261]